MTRREKVKQSNHFDINLLNSLGPGTISLTLYRSQISLMSGYTIVIFTLKQVIMPRNRFYSGPMLFCPQKNAFKWSYPERKKSAPRTLFIFPTQSFVTLHDFDACCDYSVGKEVDDNTRLWVWTSSMRGQLPDTHIDGRSLVTSTRVLCIFKSLPT